MRRLITGDMRALRPNRLPLGRHRPPALHQMEAETKRRHAHRAQFGSARTQRARDAETRESYGTGTSTVQNETIMETTHASKFSYFHKARGKVECSRTQWRRETASTASRVYPYPAHQRAPRAVQQFNTIELRGGDPNVTLDLAW